MNYYVLIITLGLSWINPNLISDDHIDIIEQNKIIEPRLTRILKKTTLSHISKHCQDFQLTRAILEVESSINKDEYQNVVTDEGSIGIMQVRETTASWIKCKAQNTDDLLNIELNIACGCRYLARLSHVYKDQKDLIASYNAGSPRICTTGTLRPSGKPCIIGKYINQDYVDKVLSNLNTEEE